MDKKRILYLFTNTPGDGFSGFEQCIAMADDGTVIGSHLCSNVTYMFHDLTQTKSRNEAILKHFKTNSVTIKSLKPGDLPPKEVLELHDKQSKEVNHDE